MRKGGLQIFTVRNYFDMGQLLSLCREKESIAKKRVIGIRSSGVLLLENVKDG